MGGVSVGSGLPSHAHRPHPYLEKNFIQAPPLHLDGNKFLSIFGGDKGGAILKPNSYDTITTQYI
jgi:hypothetical protein